MQSMNFPLFSTHKHHITQVDNKINVSRFSSHQDYIGNNSPQELRCRNVTEILGGEIKQNPTENDGDDNIEQQLEQEQKKMPINEQDEREQNEREQDANDSIFRQFKMNKLDAENNSSNSSFKKIQSKKVQEDDIIKISSHSKMSFVQKSKTYQSFTNSKFNIKNSLQKSKTYIKQTQKEKIQVPQIDNPIQSMKTLGTGKHHRINAEIRAQKRQLQKSKKLILFDYKIPVYEVRMKQVREGKYCIPFKFRLPMFLPGSFEFSTQKGFTFSISYQISALVQEFESNYSEKVIKFHSGSQNVGGKFSNFKKGYLMKHKRQFWVREFNFTDMEIRLFRAQVDRKIQGEQDPNIKKNVIQQSIQKKYRTVVKSHSKVIQEGKPKRLPTQSSSSRIVKTYMASNSKLQNIINLSQGLDLTSHQFTGLINNSTMLYIDLKFLKCCCFPRKEKVNAKIALNQSLFFCNEQIKVKLNLMCDKDQSLNLIDSIQISLMQRVVIYSDIKKRNCQTITNVLDILRVMDKNSIKSKEIFCAFRLDKLLWSDK